MKNATYLLKSPRRSFKNSECRWTAMAQICLFYLSKDENDHILPIYKSDPDGYLIENGELTVSGFTL